MTQETSTKSIPRDTPYSREDEGFVVVGSSESFVGRFRFLDGFGSEAAVVAVEGWVEITGWIESGNMHQKARSNAKRREPRNSHP
jgi:hypothetical protein